MVWVNSLRPTPSVSFNSGSCRYIFGGGDGITNHIDILEYDPAIKPLIKDLLDSGFVIGGSCQGGPYRLSPTAFITILKDTRSLEEIKEEIDSLLTGYNYKSYPNRRSRIHDCREFYGSYAQTKDKSP